MRKLLNVLYVTSPKAYLALQGENVVVKKEDLVAMQLPLHNLEQIVCFSYLGASPALMGACAERNIGICFLSPNGRFLGRVEGSVKGNVLLRKKQYRFSEDELQSVQIATSIVGGKIYNCRKVIQRAIRDHALLVDTAMLQSASDALRQILISLAHCLTISELMGQEGSAAKIYFSVFDQLILQQKEDFVFKGRSRRPPLDRINALLSFLYTLLTNEISSALETVGLDPYVGFLHQDRPGRPSLALDMMEELRPVIVDRFAVTLVNRKQIAGSGFMVKESGGVLMDDETRKKVLSLWQERKREKLEHPFIHEKIEFGLIPYVQALLMARYLRGDLDAYPPFFWK